MGSNVMPFFHRPLHQLTTSGIAEKHPGNKKSCLDLQLAQRIQNRRGALAIIPTGENQRNLFLLQLAAHDRTMIQPKSRPIISRRLRLLRRQNQKLHHHETDRERLSTCFHRSIVRRRLLTPCGTPAYLAAASQISWSTYATSGVPPGMSTFFPCLISPIGPNSTVSATVVPTFPSPSL